MILPERLEAASRYLEGPTVLSSAGDYAGAISRYYYAAYQAMWAALGDPPTRPRWEHIGVINMFVRGRWDDPSHPMTGPGLYERFRLPLRRLYGLRLALNYRVESVTRETADGALEEPTNAHRFLELVHTHAERLSRLVDDLLQLSDIETGKVTLKPTLVVLHKVAAGVAAIFENQAAQKTIALLNQVPPDICVQADRDRLTQILVNLVDNAVKYTPEGGQVVVRAGRARGIVEVSVQDTGSGIPSIDLPRISERFYRVDKARSRQLGGTGLGLAIVKHLVQAHGGELRIESGLGKGTTVCFTLPAAAHRSQ